MAQLIANGTRVGGITFVTVNGVTMLAVSDVHYQSAVTNREDAGGLDGIHGFTEKTRTAVIKGRFRDMQGLDVGALQNAQGIAVSIELANGKTMSGNNMWASEIGEVDAGEGVFDAEWHGASPLIMS